MAASPISDELRAAIDGYVKADVFSGEEERQAALSKILAALDSQEVQLLDIVLHLGKPLSDPDAPQVRRQAIQLLAACLRGGKQLRLNFKHVETLARFFASKLSDWQCVEGALGGILVLLRQHAPLLRSLKGGDEGSDETLVAHLARRVFRDVNPASHTQLIRKAALDVVQELLQAWREEVSALGPQLGEGVGGTIEEERDPRNLLLSFTIARQLLADFDPACVSDEALSGLFETLTSYFPITFEPPKDDKYGITGDHLRSALHRALGATPRFAALLVPFVLDNTKDITVGDSEDTILQALEMLAACAEAYGPAVTQAHLRLILSTARDQVCRTTTPCTGEFCAAVQRVLAVALRDVPTGLQPHWLGRDVAPALAALAADAAQGGAVLASAGSRRLLLASAAAHPVLLQRVWALALPALLGRGGAGAAGAGAAGAGAAGAAAGAAAAQEALPLEATGFVAELLQLAEAPGRRPLLAARQLKPALAGALQALRGSRGGGDAQGGAEGGAAGAAACVRLAGRLCRLVGEEASAEAFRSLSLALLPPAEAAGGEPEGWAAEWRGSLSAAAPADPRFEALVGALGAVALEQPARAAELAPLLLALKLEQAPPPLLAALPRLLAAAAMGLAQRAAGAGPAASEGAAAPEPEAAAASARALLLRASELAKPASAGPERSEALAAVAEALEAAAVPAAAASWAASRLAEALALPAELPQLCGAADGGGGAFASRHVGAARSVARALSSRLPPDEARALRRQVLQAASGSAARGVQACAMLVPAVLPAAAEEDWELCDGALSAICRCMPEERQDLEEAAALEALQAIVEACPADALEPHLQNFRDTFGALLGGAGGGDVEPRAARWAVRCWAAAAAALLRRGGCAQQAAAFLEALLGALEGGASVLRQVPLAFRVLVPPRFDAAAEAGPRLPPLALQQLSLTMLPSLVERTRAAPEAAEAPARRAALESAVALLCALPVEVACSDCGEELKWCTLTGLSRLREDAERGGAPAGAEVFAAQVLQLLVRAASQGAPWIEDELHSIVAFVAGAGAAHGVPLVRLGSMQSLLRLVQTSRGHLAPFRKQIEAATRRAIEDRRREVRLMAVACLNAWHCGTAVDG